MSTIEWSPLYKRGLSPHRGQDVQIGFYEARFGRSPPPFLGSPFLLEDHSNVKTPGSDLPFQARWG